MEKEADFLLSIELVLDSKLWRIAGLKHTVHLMDYRSSFEFIPQTQSWPMPSQSLPAPFLCPALRAGDTGSGQQVCRLRPTGRVVFDSQSQLYLRHDFSPAYLLVDDGRARHSVRAAIRPNGVKRTMHLAVRVCSNITVLLNFAHGLAGP
jgi:hypothetical protein